MTKQQIFNLEPDIVTKAFSVRRVTDALKAVADALADLEAARKVGTTPLLVAGDIVCLYLSDFLRTEGKK